MTSIIKHGYTCSVLFVIFINPLVCLLVKLNNGCFHIEKAWSVGLAVSAASGLRWEHIPIGEAGLSHQ